MSQKATKLILRFPYLARMGRVANEGVKLPTEEMNLVVLRRAIAAAAAAAAVG